VDHPQRENSNHEIQNQKQTQTNQPTEEINLVTGEIIHFGETILVRLNISRNKIFSNRKIPMGE